MIRELLQGADWLPYADESMPGAHSAWKVGELIVMFSTQEEDGRIWDYLVPLDQYRPEMGKYCTMYAVASDRTCFEVSDMVHVFVPDYEVNRGIDCKLLAERYVAYRLVASDRVQEEDVARYLEAVHADVIRRHVLEALREEIENIDGVDGFVMSEALQDHINWRRDKICRELAEIEKRRKV